jgi:hypothetical protein
MQLLILNVSNNKLQSLPESIGSCFSLEELQANGMFLIDGLAQFLHFCIAWAWQCMSVFPCVLTLSEMERDWRDFA